MIAILYVRTKHACRSKHCPFENTPSRHKISNVMNEILWFWFVWFRFDYRRMHHVGETDHKVNDISWSNTVNHMIVMCACRRQRQKKNQIIVLCCIKNRSTSCRSMNATKVVNASIRSSADVWHRALLWFFMAFILFWSSLKSVKKKKRDFIHLHVTSVASGSSWYQ